MAGNSWQPSHEPPQKSRHPSHRASQWKEERRGGDHYNYYQGTWDIHELLLNYWQPAPKSRGRRPLLWLATLGNPAMSPPKKAGTHHTEQASEKRKGGGGTTIIILSPHDCETPINAQQNCPKTPKPQNALTQLNIHCVLYTQNSKSMWEPSWSMSKITLALLVVNSVKLHLTAFKLSR